MTPPIVTAHHFDPATEVGERVTCHGFSARRSYCGHFLGRFTQAVGFIVCPRCGNREQVNICADS